MKIHGRGLRPIGAVMSVCLLSGCQSVERAPVEFSYVVEAERDLPPGMKNIAILPAKVGPTTDPKWSDLAITVLHSLVDESRNRFGTDVTVSDRRDTQVTFDEADLVAEGLSTLSSTDGGKLLAAQGAILSNINVKVERYEGKQRTLSAFDIGAYGGRSWYGRRWGGGHAAVDTEEVSTVTRNLTVQTEFKLVDTSNNQVWSHYSPPTYSGTDRTKSSALFGSSSTEADLTPQDRIIGGLVERAARKFISQLMPCRIDVHVVALSSRQPDCVAGVRLVRAEAYEDAVARFRAALGADPDDHRAAFGAGVACEASGRYDEALKFYRRACGGQDNKKYRLRS